MRRRGTAKQRFWLGPNRYRSCCRNTATNPNCFANTCLKCYSVRAVNANTYAKRACVTYTYSDGNSDGDSYTPSESNTYSERHHSSYAYTDGDCHSYRSAQGNPKASSDSAFSAVSAEIRGER